MKYLFGLSVLCCAFLAGCGSDEVSGCDFREEGELEQRCQDREGEQGGPAFETFCDGLDGTSLSEGCPVEEIVGGCLIGESVLGSRTIDWFYAPMSQEQYELECDADERIPAP